MRRVLSGVGVALFVAARAATAQGFTIDWSHTTVTGGQLLPGQGPDRAAALELRADNPKAGPTSSGGWCATTA